MGGVAFLHPQGVLRDRSNYNRMPLISSPKNDDFKTRGRNADSNSNPRSVSNANRRKRSPQKKANDSSRSPPPKSFNLGHSLNGGTGLPRSVAPKGAASSGNGTDLVMGKVKILKRGEALTKDEKKGNEDSKAKKNDDLDSIEMLLSRLGPEANMVPKQIRLAGDFYAGSAFDASPPPSSLPVPEFFFKKRTTQVEVVDNTTDVASTDLCRLLKLSGFQISI